MFTTSSENRDYAVKPMNCPGHILIYNKGVRSYRDLPLRYGEFGSCHRNEPSGALHGLMRVRGFVQDDGHIFCTEEQILDECVACTALLQKVYRDFGFTDIIYKVATRPAKRIGSDEAWDKAELALKNALESPRRGFPSSRRRRVLRAEDRVLAEGRHRARLAVRHDAGGLQHAGRLGAEYVAEDNTRRTPVMLPRDRGLLRALHRHPDRALRRRVSAVARAAPGGDDDHRATERIRAVGRESACQSRFRVISDLRNEKDFL